MMGSLPVNKFIIQITIITIFYSILRFPLMNKALWSDEVFATFLYLDISQSKQPHLANKDMPEGDRFKYFRWGLD